MIKKKIYLIPFSILALLIFGYFLWQLEEKVFFDLLMQLNYFYLIIAVIAYFISQLFKARRFQIMIYSHKISLFKVLKVTILHNLASRILPFRSGELAYPFLLRRSYKINFLEGLSTLALARVFDAMVVFMLLLMAFLLNCSAWPTFFGYLAPVLMLFVLMVLIYFFLINSEKALKKLIARGNKKRSKRGIKRFIINKTREFLSSFLIIKNKKITGRVLINTLIFWFFVFMAYNFLIQAVGIKDLSTVQMFLVVMILNSVANIPISFFAEIGLFEGGYVLALLFFGINRELAINSSVIVHFIIIAISLFLFITLYFKDIFFRKSPKLKRRT